MPLDFHMKLVLNLNGESHVTNEKSKSWLDFGRCYNVLVMWQTWLSEYWSSIKMPFSFWAQVVWFRDIAQNPDWESTSELKPDHNIQNAETDTNLISGLFCNRTRFNHFNFGLDRYTDGLVRYRMITVFCNVSYQKLEIVLTQKVKNTIDNCSKKV